MRLTSLIAKVVGPVLLLRGVSILIDRSHFTDMLAALDREVSTVSFSVFPIALLITCLALAAVHSDRSSIAALLIRIMLWGGIIKASALILFPRLVVAKAQLLGRADFLGVVLVVCFVLGGYFTWFGYFAARQTPGERA